MNRTLLDMARCMLIQSKLPPSFQAEAISTACYLRNRSPSSPLNKKIPYDLWANKTFNVSHLKTFGTKCYVLNKNYKGKFDPRSEEAIFFGYSVENKAYRVYNMKNKKIKCNSRYQIYQWNTK